MSRGRWLAVFAVAFLTGVGASTARALDRVDVVSPNGKLRFTVNAGSGRIEYQVTLASKTVLPVADLGVTVDGETLARSTIVGSAFRKIDETYSTHGVHSTATDRAQEAVISLRSTEKKTVWSIEVRAYDDGIAFRYRVPGSGRRHVDGESTSWKFPVTARAWFQIPGKSRRYDGYEGLVRTAAVGDLMGISTPKSPAPAAEAKTASTQPVGPPLLMAPLTVRLPDGPYVLVTEANLIDYSDMALQSLEDGTFRAYFRNDPKGWDWSDEIVSSWRVAVISADLNGLVNTDLLRNVCPPPAPELASADWIKPGRSTWHWLVTGKPVLAQQHQWVDWTKQLGFEYYTIDDGWKRWSSADKTDDAWACLKGVVDYAKTQNVCIWAWVNSNELQDTPARDAYMSRMRAIGVVGLKIDFMTPADVNRVRWYDDTLRDAAKHHLMINFHGAVKPTGRDRTWPNDLTREAVRGRENFKLPALHDIALLFTRFVQGPADYTPTDLRPDRLKGSSWAHELSMAVLFTSPLLCYGGSPENYLQNEAIGLLRAIPSTWDETVVLPGSEPGVVAAYARRKGDDWFIGILNSEPRRFSVPLHFLKAGTYSIEEFADDPEKGDAWRHSAGAVTSGDVLEVDLRNDGGFVARIRKN